MKNFEVTLVTAQLVECCNSQCENKGINTITFSAFTLMSDDCQLVIVWRHTTILADVALYVGFLDDVN